jgi:hypothetical protein
LCAVVELASTTLVHDNIYRQPGCVKRRAVAVLFTSLFVVTEERSIDNVVKMTTIGWNRGAPKCTCKPERQAAFRSHRKPFSFSESPSLHENLARLPRRSMTPAGKWSTHRVHASVDTLHVHAATPVSRVCGGDRPAGLQCELSSRHRVGARAQTKCTSNSVPASSPQPSCSSV